MSLISPIIILLILIHETINIFYPPPTLSSSVPSLTSFLFLVWVFFFLSLLILLASCPSYVRAAATVLRCIAHLRPKSLMPMGRQCGWAKMHTRWLTPALIAKTLLKAAAAKEDVEGSPPPRPRHTLQYKYLQVPELSLWPLSRCHMSCLTGSVKVLVQVRANHPEYVSLSSCRELLELLDTLMLSHPDLFSTHCLILIIITHSK